jgi:hypothetical protein
MMMKLTILFFSFFLGLTGCSYFSNESQDLMDVISRENDPERGFKDVPRIPVYVYPHTNAHGDFVTGAWIGIKKSAH